jgi:hypothetical protein
VVVFGRHFDLRFTGIFMQRTIFVVCCGNSYLTSPGTRILTLVLMTFRIHFIAIVTGIINEGYILTDITYGSFIRRRRSHLFYLLNKMMMYVAVFSALS